MNIARVFLDSRMEHSRRFASIESDTGKESTPGCCGDDARPSVQEAREDDMDSQSSERVGAVGARTARVESQLAAARRVLQDKRSEAEIALDTAVERMVADMAAAPDRPAERVHAQSGAVEETAPAVRVMARSVAHTAGTREHA
jgi:hypothetical protein